MKVKTTASTVALALKIQAEKRSIIRRGSEVSKLSKATAKSVNKL